DEPDRVRLLSVEDAAGEDDVQRAPEPDDPGQALGAAVDQRYAEAALGEAEPRAARRDPDVTPKRELQPTGEAPARDRRDRRRARGAAGEAERAVGVVEPVREGVDRLQVGAGAEGVLARAGEHEHA